MTEPAHDPGTVVAQTLSVVIPVYRAGPALETTCREILEVCADVSPVATVEVRLEELILVCDNPGLPDDVLAHLAGLAELDERVRVVWLSRNFGQHPATVAGIVSTNGDWVVTMDEDGQHDPAFIRDLLATAGRSRTPLVYAAPSNARPHGAVRNATSWASGRVARSISGVSVRFHSFRLLDGGLARSSCAYAGENVFLDVALSWTCGPPATCPVELRQEEAPSSYNYRRLVSHFWRLVVTSGTRPLRAIAVAGVVVALSGLLVGAYLLVQRITGAIDVPGWTSVIIAMLVLVGGLYVAVAVVAEYVGQAVRNTVGRPVYVRVDAPVGRPLYVLHSHMVAVGGVGGVGRRGRGARGRPGLVRLIAGSSGVVGSGFCDVLRSRGQAFTRMELPWHDPVLVADRVVDYWLAAQEADPGSPITLVWAAGTGTVAASEEVMLAETATLREVVDALGRRVRPDMANCMMFASSAGAVFGGHGGGLIGESTPPAPITAYGREKLVQEGIVAGLAASGVMRTVSCRFTNVFGLAGGRLRRKGLVAVLVDSAMLRRPARLFVSPDTRRDYLFNRDAARLALAEVDAAMRGGATAASDDLGSWDVGTATGAAGTVPAGTAVPGTAVPRTAVPGTAEAATVRSGAATVTIISAGSTMTILDVVASTSRVLRRRVPVVITESPESRVQPLVLRFHERSGIQAAVPTTSLEAALRVMAEAPRA